MDIADIEKDVRPLLAACPPEIFRIWASTLHDLSPLIAKWEKAIDDVAKEVAGV